MKKYEKQEKSWLAKIFYARGKAKKKKMQNIKSDVAKIMLINLIKLIPGISIAA
jgi:hypothetical protein